MAVTPELREITRNISSEMGGVVGNIRKTANDNQKMFSVILKDIGAHFSAQSSALDDVSSTVEQTSNRVATKVDSTNNLLQEQIGILSNVYAELRSLNSGIKTLNVNTLDSNKGLLNGLMGGLRGLQNVIIGGLASAAPAVGMIGAGVAGSMMFGGGESISPAIPFSGPNKPILDTIKERESGGNYQAQAKTSSASGAYQFIDETWQTWQRKSGVGTNYTKAKFAPPEIQDKVADAYISDILKRAGGDVSKVPIEWYTGNLQGKMSAEALRRNNGLTPESYQAKWLKDFAKHGGAKAMAAATTTPAAPNATTSSSSTPATKSDATPVTKPEAMTPGAAESAESSKEHAGHGGHEGIITGKNKERSADAGRVTQSQSGIRNMPINDKLMGVLQKAAAEAGVAVNITSGAQPNFPQGPRTGTTRHDIGVGAADLDLMQNGRVLTDHNPEDVKIKRKFVEAAAAAGATGIGAGEGYMGASKIHVGFGKPATWGGAGWLSGLNLGSSTTPESEKGTSGATPYSGGSAVTPGMGGESYDQRLSAIQENINKLGGGVPESEQTGSSPFAGMMGIPAHGFGGAVNIQEYMSNIQSNMAQIQQSVASPNLMAPAAAMVSAPLTSQATQAIQQAQVEDQVEDYTFKENMMAYNEQTKKVTTEIAASEKTSGTPVIYDYNNASDVGWPDWASMVGGNHWSELKLKLNMFG